MDIGPYRVKEDKIFYKGNKLFSSIKNIEDINSSSLEERYVQISRDEKKWRALINIWNDVFLGTVEFMKRENAKFADLPLITRMISSPGAISRTIISDSKPFSVRFFGKVSFLSQSSQLFLELLLTNPVIDKVYYWGKNFRREKSDFRHLAEFNQVEFEGKVNFERNLLIQERFVKYVIKYLLRNTIDDLCFFLDKRDIESLSNLVKIKRFERISFREVFRLLKKETNNKKYNNMTLKNFGAYEEVMITEIIGKPVFVTDFIEEEIAFYHKKEERGNHKVVFNDDLLFPGYGEIIGGGERICSYKALINKMKKFKINVEDYKMYLLSRKNKIDIHSGWGLGVERFIQALLKLPFIWEVVPFPRVHSLRLL